MKELSNEEVDRIAAIEVLGWEEDRDPDGTFFGYLGEGAPWGVKAGNWHPTTCRNQSRMVVWAACEVAGFDQVADWLEQALTDHEKMEQTPDWLASPRQEVEAAILAVRASKGEEPT